MIVTLDSFTRRLRNTIKGLLLLSFALVPFSSIAGIQAQSPVAGENFTNPLGMDLGDIPTLSWKLPAARNGIRQTAYRIVASDTREGLESNPLWDTGRVTSSQNRHVQFQGGALKSRQKVWWKVLFWDENGDASDWSPPQSFEAGLLNNREWKGLWISSADAPKSVTKKIERGKKSWTIKRKIVAPARLRKEILLPQKKITLARLYIASRGWYTFRINAEKISNERMGTGWTQFDAHVQSATFDVTKLLRDGSNIMSIVLSDGRNSGRILDVANAYADKPEIIAQLEVFFEDGSFDTFVTDASWKYSKCEVLEADIYDGETYDARAFNPAVFESEFDDSSWKNVDSRPTKETEKILPRRCAPVEEITSLKPLSLKKLSDGKFIFDFGQNLSGVVRLNIRANEGDTLRLRYAEMLNKDGSLYTDNLRSAICEDKYICIDGLQTWESEHSIHGFRYVEISGFSADTKVTSDIAEAVVLHTKMEKIGNFVCSNPKINRLQSNIEWGIRSNFLDVPTNSPQRDERLGSTLDAQIFCATAANNMDVSAFFSKWLLDLRMAQTKEGIVPLAVPHINKDATSKLAPAWGDAAVITPWIMWLEYGNKRFLSESWDSIKRHLNYVDANFESYSKDTSLGDLHQANSKRIFGNTPTALIATAYATRTNHIASKIARVLGDAELEKKYSIYAQKYKNLFIKNFVSPDGKIVSETQTAYLLALGFDIIPQDLRTKVRQRFLEKLQKDKFALQTGFIGTPLLLQTITDLRLSDELDKEAIFNASKSRKRNNYLPELIEYKILFGNKYPSWIYSIDQGATTMWESWNAYSDRNGFCEPETNSFNHCAFGAVGKWIYENFGGMRPDENAAGYANIIFAPIPPREKKCFASVSRDTPYGLAKSQWRISDMVMEWTVTIPPNATGTLIFPTDDETSIRLEGRILPKGKLAKIESKPALKNVPSGTYQFLMRVPNTKISKK